MRGLAYALAHGSLAGVPADAVNLLISNPVTVPRGGAIVYYEMVNIMEREDKSENMSLTDEH